MVKNGLLVLMLTLSISSVSYSQHQHHTNNDKQSEHKPECVPQEIRCAQTVTSAFSPDGRLWRLWAGNNSLYFNVSNDNGESFTEPTQVNLVDEPISARGENRPKIGFDHNNGVYLSWATPKEKRFTADVRFSYSSDDGKSFSVPITVNDDGLLAGHSFNEMQVSAQGEVSLIWLDSRKKAQNPTQEVNGSSIFFARANPSKQDFHFNNRELISGTCQCCRLSFGKNANAQPVLMWRHIFGKNTREFALMTVDEQAQVRQISQDEWQIDGCPHQGGAISIDDQNRYHMVWYNQGNRGKGIFYAYSDDQGKSLGKVHAVGNNAQRAAHPHMLHSLNRVDIVWTEFDGKQSHLWHQSSKDKGVSFSAPVLLATATDGSDRPFLLTNGDKVLVSWHRPKQGHWIKTL